jgi:hypothetical protein
MTRNPAKIDHLETASALNLRSHSIDTSSIITTGALRRCERSFSRKKTKKQVAEQTLDARTRVSSKQAESTTKQAGQYSCRSVVPLIRLLCHKQPR